MWVARATGALLTGVDISPVAVAQAADRAASFGLADRAQFQVGEFAATGLPGATFDAAMSVDVLWLAPDKSAALREVARILRPRGRFVFTSWDFATSPPDEPQPSDHRPLLRAAGFVVEAYALDTSFEARFRALLKAYEAERLALRSELGAERAERMIAHYQRRLGLFPGMQRILVVGRQG
jgi:ubiquinone/menaquinone biosynthesis C-methylase UbiE